MRGVFHSKFGILAMVCALFSAGAGTTQAATVMLDAYVSYSINQSDTSTPLVDGSIVYLIGSPSETNLGPVQWGDDLIASSVQGNEVLLATIRIGDGIFGDADSGMFSVFLEVPSTIDHFYIRFFETAISPVSGTHYWGSSSVLQRQDSEIGFAAIDFTPTGSISTSQQDSFVVIPEPGTLQLALLATAFLLGLTSFLRKKRAAEGA